MGAVGVAGVAGVAGVRGSVVAVVVGVGGVGGVGGGVGVGVGVWWCCCFGHKLTRRVMPFVNTTVRTNCAGALDGEQLR